MIEQKKYQIIYADPPWSYYNDSDSYFGKTTNVGLRKPPYPVLSTQHIKELPIKEIIHEDCVLFIWTTDYHLKRCLEVIQEWGFQYKTVGFVWLKKNKVGNPVCFMGAYTLKSGVELCLLATRGDAHKLVKKHNIRALIESVRQSHSVKPDEVRDRIVQLMGDLPRIELFARQKTPGWDVWGNEVESDIELKC